LQANFLEGFPSSHSTLASELDDITTASERFFGVLRFPLCAREEAERKAPMKERKLWALLLASRRAFFLHSESEGAREKET